MQDLNNPAALSGRGVSANVEFGEHGLSGDVEVADKRRVRRFAFRRNIPSARLSGFALGYPLATLGPHFVRRLPRALTLLEATPIFSNSN